MPGDPFLLPCRVPARSNFGSLLSKSTWPIIQPPNITRTIRKSMILRRIILWRKYQKGLTSSIAYIRARCHIFENLRQISCWHTLLEYGGLFWHSVWVTGPLTWWLTPLSLSFIGYGKGMDRVLRQPLAPLNSSSYSINLYISAHTKYQGLVAIVVWDWD